MYNRKFGCKPTHTLSQELYNSRCSCLVGVADVYRNMTGEFPQCLSMSGCCYACQLLEPNFFMVGCFIPLQYFQFYMK